MTMALKKCRECGNDISTKAAACPKCGAVLKKKGGCLSVVVLLFLIGIVIAAISSVTHETSSSSQTSPPAGSGQSTRPSTPPTPVRPDLEVVDYNWASGEFGNRVIRGTVRNNTSKQYKYVQVEINLYDKADTQVGSTLANVNNLEPGRTWRFEAAVLEESASKAKVKDITGF
jgi:hypothetical protein